MNKNNRFLIVLCLMAVSIIFPVRVFANPLGISYEKNICYGIPEEQKGSAAFNIGITNKMLQGGEIIKVTSSNKSVVKKIMPTKNAFQFVVRKYGKTTFTITIKTAKNKNKKYKCNFSAVKYSNPISSIKLGQSGNLASGLKKGTFYRYMRTMPSEKLPVSEKISIKPKAGWKLVSLSYWYYDQEKGRSVGKNIKNNTSIKYHYSSGKSANGSIGIRMKNDKKGEQQALTLDVSIQALMTDPSVSADQYLSH